MKVLKFGGGCLKDAKSIKKVPSILKKYTNDSIIIVVSAFGKMTTPFLAQSMVAPVKRK